MLCIGCSLGNGCLFSIPRTILVKNLHCCTQSYRLRPTTGVQNGIDLSNRRFGYGIKQLEGRIDLPLASQRDNLTIERKVVIIVVESSISQCTFRSIRLLQGIRSRQRRCERRRRRRPLSCSFRQMRRMTKGTHYRRTPNEDGGGRRRCEP